MPSKNKKPTWIRGALLQKGKSIPQLAKMTGWKLSPFYQATRRPLPRYNHAIAQALGLHVSQIWPEWFFTDGQRKPTYEPKLSKNEPLSPVKNAK